MGNIARSTIHGDPEGCICPQDYVEPRCPIHDPDGTYYPMGESEVTRLRRRLAGAVEALERIAAIDPQAYSMTPPLARLQNAVSIAMAAHAQYGGQ